VDNYFLKFLKCGKCSKGNTLLNCPKSKKSKAKSVNCGEGYIANKMGCFIDKNAGQKANPKKIS